mgnify:CR=1 FL=1
MQKLKERVDPKAIVGRIIDSMGAASIEELAEIVGVSAQSISTHEMLLGFFSQAVMNEK